MKLKVASLGILFAIANLPGAAVAAGDTFGSLLSGIGNIAKTIVQPQAPAGVDTIPTEQAAPAAVNTSDANVERVIDIVANGGLGLGSLCRATDLNEADADVRRNLDAGDAQNAALAALFKAQSLAGCRNHANKFPTISERRLVEVPLHTWAGVIGRMLTMSLTLDQKLGSGLQDSIHKKRIEHTRTLLTYASSHGEPSAMGDLKQLEKVAFANQSAGVSSQSALTGSVEQVVAAFNKNSFGFDQKYLNKTIIVSGPIRTISGTPGRQVRISMLGTPGKDPDLIGWSDSVACIITSKAGMDKAVELGKGDRIKVRGVYRQHNDSPQVVLASCEVL